jgi:uncharacterized membrane protein SpoIIM required for sporulation
MKEITFLKQNHAKWLQFEELLDSQQGNDPDALAELFVRITDDLSWARTFYPDSNTEKYLNDLAARIHQEIYKNKKERRSRLLTFWTRELPLLMAKQRLNLLIAFLIFGISTWVGVISAQNDEGFVRLILGDGYVDETLKRMSDGDPLGVYKQDNQFLMFFQIALNNSRVALLCIVAGILGWIGVGYLQFYNGVMLGSFFWFLSSNGYTHEAFHTVWIHGVIEIWCIVVAGAAGMAFGNALWFPGAWPRSVSFMRGTREALKIGLGLVPFFFLAAFLEGFVTRYTEMNDFAREFIIFGSLVFVIWYFVIYPIIVEYRNREMQWASPTRRIITIIVILFAAFLSFPISLIPLLAVPVNHDNRKLTLLQYLFNSDKFNPNTLSQFLLGLLLLLLPSISLIMVFVTGKLPDILSWIFFACCYTAGLLCMIWGIYILNKSEETDLEIVRKNSRKADYEQKARAIKV